MRYGYFDDKNKEYVIERPDTPVSWTNYMGINKYCGIITNNASGYSFFDKSQYNRLIRMRFNSIPMDRPGRYIYIRDDDNKDYWSVSWQPVGKDLSVYKNECRHGLGYTRIKSTYDNIETEALYFVPLKEPVEIWELTVKNIGSKTRNLSLFTYAEFSFWKIEKELFDFTYILYVTRPSFKDDILSYYVLFDSKLTKGKDEKKGFILSTEKVKSFDTNRELFIGPYRSESNPIAVERGSCSNIVEEGGNSCGSLHNSIALAPGETKKIVYVLGIGDAFTYGRKIKQKYSAPNKVSEEFGKLNMYWEKRLVNFSCETPDPGINSMVNIWNQYQSQVAFHWSRFVSFIEVGWRGGLGFRDGMQDVFSIAHSVPKEAKQRLIDIMIGQVSTGHGIHNVVPEKLREQRIKRPPLETICSDDHLWMPLAVAFYIKETGDKNFLKESISYADKGKSSVYEHLRRAIDFSLKHTGNHNICLGYSADWNDCINLRNGGESVWLTFLLYKAMSDFIDIASLLNKKKDKEKYFRLREKVRQNIEKIAWDGDWYIRAITSKNEIVGSKKNKEGRIYLNPQIWAVYSGLSQGERAKKCMDSVYKYLYTKHGALIMSPSYTEFNGNIGTITTFPKGLKENGSIFCHPNPWITIAECMLGRGNLAYKYYSNILPYNSNDNIEVHQAEPYVYCQFIYGKDHKNFGRARHPWLTGTSTWNFVAVTNYIFGFRAEFDGFVIDPCIPEKWGSFKFSRRFRGADYEITVKNPDHVSKGVKDVFINGKKTTEKIFRPLKPGTKNTIEIIMGKYPRGHCLHC